MFGHKDFEPGEAVIVETHVKHHGSDGRNTLFEWLADVTPSSGEPAYRTTLQMPNLATDFREPSQGDHVSVLIDRKKGVTHFDKSDPRISLKAERVEKDREFQQTASGSAGTPAPDTVGRPRETTVTEPQVVSAADAGPLLAAMFGGDPAAREQAIAELRDHAHPPSADLGERLGQLETLKASGAISDAEYQSQRQRIIDSI